MREGWEVKKLGEVLKIQNGYAFNSKLFTIEKGTPLIRIRDIKNGLVTETNFNGTYDKKYEVKAGDFLIGMDGEFGCYEWKGDIALLNQRVCRLQEFSKELDSRFLFYGINKYLKAIEDVTAFATVKHISSKQIENIEIPLPPLSEQQRIVALLDEAFAAIAKAKANAEQNLKNAKELFESYLQSVFENKGEGWEEKALSEFCEVKDGTHDSPKYVKEGIPFVTQKNIRQDGLSFTDTKFITETDHSKFYKRSNVRFGDILISMIGANRGMACIVNDKRVFSIKNVGLIKESENINKHFLLYYLKSPLAMRYVLYMSNGGAQEFIGLTALRSFPISSPPLKDQQTIVQKLDALSTQTKKLEAIYQQHLNDLEELKKSILQKAFNGEL
ncbi:restriction endonuclease subunit S [Methylosoma difficile]